MRWIRFMIILLLVTILNTGNLLNFIALSPLNIRPDLLLIALVFFAVNCSSRDAIIASFIIGLAADIAQAPLGPHIISFCLFGSVLAQMRTFIVFRKMLHQGVAIFIVGILTGTLTYILLCFKSDQPVPNIFSTLLGTSLYSAVVGPYIYWLFSTMTHWIGIKTYRLETRTGG